MRRKHVYGPVPSRRFGLSLGVDVVPHKVCTLDCVYCQVGPTTRVSIQRECFVPPEEVIADVKEALDAGPTPGIITFAGSGEPTLYSQLGLVAAELKKYTKVPLLLITNGTLLYRDDVVQDALLFDRVAPSLDAADPATFQAINQPHPELDLNRIIQGLAHFSKIYKGELDLELFFLEGVNDSPLAVEALAQAVRNIAPTRIDLNTAVRPTPHRTVRKASPEFLAALEKRFSVPARSVFSGASFQTETSGHKTDAQLEETLLSTLERRPCTLPDLSSALNIEADRLANQLTTLQAKGVVATELRDGNLYFVRVSAS